MTAIQQTLWPDEVETDPDVVSMIYNNSALAYACDSIKDGWDSTFLMLNSELQHLLSTTGVESGRLFDYGEEQNFVLDAGCGDGLLADYFDFSTSNCCLHGIDISSEMVSIARTKNKYDHLTITNLVEDTLPFPDEYFDVVVANGVLGYCATSRPLYELLRVLKPQGHILICMRSHHFQDRGYPRTMAELKGKCEILKRQVFDCYPNNPDFKHEYNLIVVKKCN